MASSRIIQSRIIQASLDEVSSDPSKISNADIIICVSVGQSIHYDGNLAATYSLLANLHDELISQGYPGIRSITVSVNGSLQRHNFWYFACNPNRTGNFIPPLKDQKLYEELNNKDNIPENVDEEQLAECLAKTFLPYAEQAEQEYVSMSSKILRHSTLFEKVCKDHKPIKFYYQTWNEWLSHENYLKEYKDLISLYNQDVEVSVSGKTLRIQEAFNKTSDKILNSATGSKAIINEAIKRIIKSRPDLEKLDFKKVARIASSSYLMEECPIIIPLWRTLNYHVIYPQNMSLAFLATASATNVSVNWHVLKIKDIDAQVCGYAPLQIPQQPQKIGVNSSKQELTLSHCASSQIRSPAFFFEANKEQKEQVGASSLDKPERGCGLYSPKLDGQLSQAFFASSPQERDIKVSIKVKKIYSC
jgi:hypothetical protein